MKFHTWHLYNNSSLYLSYKLFICNYNVSVLINCVNLQEIELDSSLGFVLCNRKELQHVMVTDVRGKRVSVLID